MMNKPVLNICTDCLTKWVSHNILDTPLFDNAFYISTTEECIHNGRVENPKFDGDGFPICPNDCANWPQTHVDNALRCVCECHNINNIANEEVYNYSS